MENLSPEKKAKRLKSKAVSEKERRANKKECSKKSSPRTRQTRLTMQEPLMSKIHPELPDEDDLILSGDEIEKLIKKGINLATRTWRENSKHQASVCVVCDACIIGVEKINQLSKEHILLHKQRLSVETYEEFYKGETLNPLLVKKYEV